MPSVHEMLGWKAEGKAEGMAEGMALGMVEARREDLLKLLRSKFHELPRELLAAIRGAADLDPLTRWFDAAIAAPSLQAFAVLARQ